MSSQKCIILAIVLLAAVSCAFAKTCKPKSSACDPDVYNYVQPGLGNRFQEKFVCERQCACLAERRDTEAYIEQRCCTFIQCQLPPTYDRTMIDEFHTKVCKRSMPVPQAQTQTQAQDQEQE